MSFSNIISWGGWGWNYFNSPQNKPLPAEPLSAGPPQAGLPPASFPKQSAQPRKSWFSLRWLKFKRKRHDDSPVSKEADSQQSKFTSTIERRVVKQLQLEPPQQQNLQHLLVGLEAIWLEWQQRRLVDKAELMALLSAPRLDRDKTMSLYKERSRIVDERAAELIMAFGEFSDSLDNQQRHQLLSWIDNRRPGHRRPRLLSRLFRRRARLSW